MNFQYLHRYPFIRLLFPLIAGFLVGNGLFLGSLCFEGRAGRRAGRIISSAPSRLFFSPLLFTLDVRLYFVPVRVFWRSRWNKSGFATDALFFFGTKMCLPGCSVGTTGAEGT